MDSLLSFVSHPVNIGSLTSWIVDAEAATTTTTTTPTVTLDTPDREIESPAAQAERLEIRRELMGILKTLKPSELLDFVHFKNYLKTAKTPLGQMLLFLEIREYLKGIWLSEKVAVKIGSRLSELCERLSNGPQMVKTINTTELIQRIGFCSELLKTHWVHEKSRTLIYLSDFINSAIPKRVLISDVMRWIFGTIDFFYMQTHEDRMEMINILGPSPIVIKNALDQLIEIESEIDLTAITPKDDQMEQEVDEMIDEIMNTTLIDEIMNTTSVNHTIDLNDVYEEFSIPIEDQQKYERIETQLLKYCRSDTNVNVSSTCLMHMETAFSDTATCFNEHWYRYRYEQILSGREWNWTDIKETIRNELFEHTKLIHHRYIPLIVELMIFTIRKLLKFQIQNREWAYTTLAIRSAILTLFVYIGFIEEDLVPGSIEAFIMICNYIKEKIQRQASNNSPFSILSLLVYLSH